ncbi:30S ribosomal protein S9 [Candidatus Woesearchaeota archaeon]|nr:30S ribosomal protein S9 [Candidatus Woesearchaeota archaeon]
MEKLIQTHGTRKRAVARANLTSGKGIVTINNQLLSSFSGPTNRLRISEPLVLAGDLAKNIDIDILVRGGGANGQADASRLAIARALVKYDPKLKSQFYEYDRLLLVGDVRRKEVRKPNDSKARAARQKSYR